MSEESELFTEEGELLGECGLMLSRPLAVVAVGGHFGGHE